MSQKNLNPPKWPKLLLMLSLFFAITAISFVSCQKGIEKPASDEFNVAAAKEWYYGTFKKSPEWKNSPLHGKKLPDWKKGFYRKVGNIEMVEFPLVKIKTSISVSSNAQLTNAQKQRIAEASLSRIVFIKKDDKVLIREIDYIPDWEYLQNKGFDISHIIIGSPKMILKVCSW